MQSKNILRCAGRMAIVLVGVALISCPAGVSAQGFLRRGDSRQSDRAADASCPLPPTLDNLVETTDGDNQSRNAAAAGRAADVVEAMTAIANLRSEADWQALCAQYPQIATQPAIIVEKNRILALRREYATALEQLGVDGALVDAVRFDTDAAYRLEVKGRTPPNVYGALMTVYRQRQELQMVRVLGGMDLSTREWNDLMTRMRVAVRGQPAARRIVNGMLASWACVMQTVGVALGYSANQVAQALRTPVSTAARGLRMAGKGAGLAVLVYLGYLLSCLMLWLAGLITWSFTMVAWFASHVLFIQPLLVVFPALGAFICQLGLAGLFAGLALGAANPLNPDRGQSGRFLQDAGWYVNHGAEGVRRALTGGYNLENPPLYF